LSFLEAVFFGVLQGITEFLPVSSSGHLVIAQRLFGFNDPALFFDICLHCGTLAAVCVVLRRDIFDLLRHPFQKTTLFLIIATVMTAVLAFGFKIIKIGEPEKSLLELTFGSSVFLGCAFLLTSMALFIAERLSQRALSKKQPGIFDAVLIGLLQGIAVLPGISRSGWTLAGALGCRFERGFAAKFSFLLSIPAILGALVFELKDSFQNQTLPAPLPTAAGTIAAVVTGFFAVKFMLGIVQRRPLYGFSIYTAILGISVFIFNL
jgi:undecaprenyl-diphosphatase